MYRHEPTEGQWRQVEPLLPPHGRRSVRGDRTFSNGVLFLMKTGCPWRDLPERWERAEGFASGGKLGARPARGVFGGT